MAVLLDHTIVAASDAEASATFLADVLGLPEPKHVAHFVVVQTDNGVSLDFASTSEPIRPQHYAFHLSDDEWEASFARVLARELPYWADPYRHRPGEVSQYGGGRRVYFEDPDGHFMEIFTAP
jgi:catechol 2,3-dioxygenase-like lactoylglutathione lyase family enzyme